MFCFAERANTNLNGKGSITSEVCVCSLKSAQDCKAILWSNVSKSGFILERNMHFVVANIVTPLTQSKGVSFVALWGGRRVDYFVSLGIVFWAKF